MKVKIFMIKDNVVGSFISNPILLHNDKEAERVAVSLCKDPGGFADKIQDCAIYSLGSIDIDTGVIDSDVDFKFNLVDFMEVKKNEVL